MKGWTTATTDGSCVYDGARWKAGERIFRVQGSTWMKDFCADCARSRHGAGKDTGEVQELSDSPTYPKPLKALADRVGERFDSKAAAARNDE